MDRRIDERFRKPRRTKGTPFYIQRNYWAAGTIAVCGLSFFLLQLLPGFKSLDKYSRKHIREDSEDVKLRQEHTKIARTNPFVDSLLQQTRERLAYKDEPKPQGWVSRIFTKPDL